MAAEELPLPLIFALVIFVPQAIGFIASLLQRSRIGGKIPESLEGIYDAKEYDTSTRYTKAKSDFSLVKDIFDIFFLFGFWFLKGFPLLDEVAVSFGFSMIPTGLVFFALFFSINFVMELPFDIYSTFVLEERFGFNKTTPLTFVKDRLKGLLLGVLIGIPVLYVILWFFSTFPDRGWLYVFFFIMVVQLVLLFLMPVVILPMFLEMIPLPEGKALVTEEVEKADSGNFLSARVFFAHDDKPNGKECWMTKDRRFAGGASGATLSISFQSAEQDSGGQWVMCEGEPGKGGTVYATSKDVTGSTSNWNLTEQAKTALNKTSDVENNPLMDAMASKDSLSTICVDIGSLRQRLLDLAERLGYQGASIFVIDGSSRSSHSNAFCMGFGRFRRICLFDTLLPLMTEEEIIAVLGHEIGHDRLYHVHSTLVVTIAYLAVQFYFLGQFITSEVIGHAFFVPVPKIYVGLLLFFLIWGVVDFVFSIPLTVKTRFQEYQADRYSIDADKSHAITLSSGLKKLVKKSKANLTPHPFYVFLHYSHPPLDVRLEAIAQYAESRR
jgi:Zn-dependent protease with chaperone function